MRQYLRVRLMPKAHIQSFCGDYLSVLKDCVVAESLTILEDVGSNLILASNVGLSITATDACAKAIRDVRDMLRMPTAEHPALTISDSLLFRVLNNVQPESLHGLNSTLLSQIPEALKPALYRVSALSPASIQAVADLFDSTCSNVKLLAKRNASSPKIIHLITLKPGQEQEYKNSIAVLNAKVSAKISAILGKYSDLNPESFLDSYSPEDIDSMTFLMYVRRTLVDMLTLDSHFYVSLTLEYV